ncbi:uncharacterized protein LOC127246854 [Andrographis paniculata]|uniref:uncharacterized protein LOC127246854 n=1 Tax=Andrographis paniculata TaxID=175694 RepID=UPI0021E8C0EC|nr:uncharacterized protein LOC127246854 [Andrographis paniculata]
MVGWLQITLIAVSAGAVSVVLILACKRCCSIHKTLESPDLEIGRERDLNRHRHGLQSGIARLHQVSPHHQHHLAMAAAAPSIKPYNNNYHLFQRRSSSFSWADHPSLVTDAVENGWSRFAFTDFASSSSSSVKSARLLLGACADSGGEPSLEIGWEVSEGSADFLQKIRLNPNSKKIGATMSVIRAALPLPGPNLGNNSFPQEAYFEVTILSCNGMNSAGADPLSARRWRSEGDKIKLIGEESDTRKTPNRVASSHSQNNRGKSKNDAVSLSVGLTGGGPLPSKAPGTYPGSVAFNSSGSVHLDGTIHAFHTDSDDDWGRPDKVIGCGYNPGQKIVFFTVDSQLVHEINCKTEFFGAPLYPTISSNAETMVLVNLGQSPFKYALANTQRTPNPCFVGPPATSPVLGFEDSRELFSMGRIDSQWQLQRNATRSNTATVNSIKSVEYDQESEGELFEIVLENYNGRSSSPSPYGAAMNQYQ